MNDRNRRSAAEVMANAARVVKAAVNIVRAAIAGGLHGAAAAAAKELLPTIIKFAVGVLIAIIVIPMFVISAMPNMFFGYETSEKDSQITMREQALSIGGAYLSLEDFEKTQQDAIITGEAAAYENQGVTIDEIRVSSKFDEEDLCWYIAINSVAHKQDLSEMKPEEVQSLLISNLKHTTRLESSGSQTVLRIIFQPLDKDKLMDDLGFDEDAKTWAGALFETSYESDALGKYKDKFEAYKPSYAGDTGYTGPTEPSPGGSGGGGGAESGGSADNTIDISGFTNPRTKNNHDLAAYAIQAWEHGWGMCGDVWNRPDGIHAPIQAGAVPGHRRIGGVYPRALARPTHNGLRGPSQRLRLAEPRYADHWLQYKRDAGLYRRSDVRLCQGKRHRVWRHGHDARYCRSWSLEAGTLGRLRRERLCH